MKIELEITPRVQRALLCLIIPVCLVGGAAVANAQSTSAAVANDTLIGQALNTLGNAVASLRADVTVLQASERVARGAITETGAVTTQTGAWISRVDHRAPGNYVFVFAPGVFASPPTCVTTANARDAVAPAIECYGVTSASIVCQATASGTPVNTAMSVLCAGS
jgi:hypothetical protein